MARRLDDTIEDQMRSVVRVELSDGRMVVFDRRMFVELGMSECLRRVDAVDECQSGRVPVRQRGEVVGTVPADFDPLTAKSRSWIYDVRPSDFKRVGNVWEAHSSLGLGDLDMLVGFRRA